jgi:hypothetical protein
VVELQVLADRSIGAHRLTAQHREQARTQLGIISRHPVDSPEGWQGLQRDLSMAEVCRIIWHEQFMQMLLNEAGRWYSPDPEYVHAARVAIRRARAAARIYQGYFKPKAVRKHLKRLRDLDVAIAKLKMTSAI